MKCPKDYENWIGRKVQMAVDADNPDWYPKVNTVGTIVRAGNSAALVNWGKESGVKKNLEGKYEWYVAWSKITPVNFNMTNEEIWEMLKPKMEKNGLKEYQGGLFLNGLMVPGYHVYLVKKANEAIALAYRSGYERAMKGRPFKIGEKKKKGGHWEPVDPNNLPKEGTKVRYGRADIYHNDSYIKLYDIGKVEYKSNIFCEEFGMKLDKERRKGCDWVFFGGSEDSLDMWVEDDE